MSGDGPESIATSADHRSKRPVKKRALTPVSAQAAGLDALFAKPDQEIRVPLPPGSAVANGRRSQAGLPEIVSNVQGSSSGAGSGEFHVYKASRRREYERLRRLEEEAKRDRDISDFEAARREREAQDAEKTKRNREKRERAKARKAKAKKSGPGEGVGIRGDNTSGNCNGSVSTSAPSSGTQGAGGRLDLPASDSGGERLANGGVKGPPVHAMSGMGDGPGLLIHDDDDD